jgi:hypothetical protein
MNWVFVWKNLQEKGKKQVEKREKSGVPALVMTDKI